MEGVHATVSQALAFVIVAVGGAVGATVRYGLTVFFSGLGGRFPWATLICNLSGALLAGLIVSILVNRQLLGSGIALLVVTGFLGSYTTLSAFSVETLRLINEGQTFSALFNVLSTVVGALLAVMIGAWCARYCQI